MMWSKRTSREAGMPLRFPSFSNNSGWHPYDQQVGVAFFLVGVVGPILMELYQGEGMLQTGVALLGTCCFVCLLCIPWYMSFCFGWLEALFCVFIILNNGMKNLTVQLTIMGVEQRPH